MTEPMTEPLFQILPAAMHGDVLRAMFKHGVQPDDGDGILIAYMMSMAEFFRGLHKEHPRDRVEQWIDWIGPNLKHNVFPTEEPTHADSK